MQKMHTEYCILPWFTLACTHVHIYEHMNVYYMIRCGYHLSGCTHTHTHIIMHTLYAPMIYPKKIHTCIQTHIFTLNY